MNNKINWEEPISKDGNFRNGTPKEAAEDAADIIRNALLQWDKLGIPTPIMIDLLIATTIHLVRKSSDSKVLQNAYIRQILERELKEYDKQKAQKDSL